MKKRSQVAGAFCAIMNKKENAMAESVLGQSDEGSFGLNKKKKIEIIQKKNEKQLLQSIAYDIDEIRSYISFIAVILAIAVAVGIVLGIGLVITTAGK